MTPIDVSFWANRYDAGADPDETYHDVLQQHDSTVERCRRLWAWKDLSRGVPFENVEPVLASTDLDEILTLASGEAVEQLGRRLVDQGALRNRTVVTPAFVLHLADSDPDDYSTRFPIFDARCWVAFAYLDRRRTGSDRLPAAATTSARKYGAFCEFFRDTIPDDVSGRTYERAIFQFGAYLGDIPVETVAEVDEHLDGMDEVRKLPRDR